VVPEGGSRNARAAGGRLSVCRHQGFRLPVVAELGSSSFHAAHHRIPGVNFGFSTRLWDRLFGTLARDRSR